MYKNQLQELAQRSCFNLPSYTCIREGPDHAPRFKATVNFNGETYECPNYCTTLRQAEHSAAEVALDALASRGPSNSLAARILDETGVYKNLLQEVSQRVGASLPTYTTTRSGLGHLPIFTCTVELASVTFTGEPAKNKKQAEKNAAMAAWSALKLLAQQSEDSSSQKAYIDEQEHVTVARALQKYRMRARISSTQFPIKFPMPQLRPASTQPAPATTSKILPLICSKTTSRNKPVGTTISNSSVCQKASSLSRSMKPTRNDALANSNTSLLAKTSITSVHEWATENSMFLPQKFPAAGAAPYIPIRHFRPHHGMAPPVTIRNAIPVYSAPPFHPTQSVNSMRTPTMGVAPPVCIRQAVPAFAAPVRVEDSPAFKVPIITPPARVENPPAFKASITPPSVLVEDSLRAKVPTSPLVQADASQAFNSHIQLENPPTAKPPLVQADASQAFNSHIQLENPPTAKAPYNPDSPQVKASSDLKFSIKASTVHIEIPQSSKALVVSLPSSCVPVPETGSVPVLETGRVVQAQLPESLLMEQLNKVKV